MRYFLSSILLFLLCQSLALKAYATENIPIVEGRIEEFTFTESKIFPGTERIIYVYIPAQINLDAPACVYVQQDGIRPNSASVMDSLIARGIIPVTVGVFVRPGEVPPPDTATLMRNNRAYEYDSMGERYGRFILEEVLPFVAEKYHLNLSQIGNDRAIGGNSSGGIAAFNAAWEFSDEFTRVYSTSPSFVAFRGGNQFPTLVRKTEAKPIRIYMRTATNDMENSAGDWHLADLEMEKALKFSGYEYDFEILDGKHGAGFKECFADALTYLWKDWPKPVKTGKSAPRVRDIILPDEPWKLLSKGFQDAKAVAVNSKGEVLFTDYVENKIYKIGTDSKIRTFVENVGYVTNLTFGAKDELYTISSRTGKLVLHDGQTGKANKVLMNDIRGLSVLATQNDGLYVSAPAKDENGGEIFFIDKKGQIKKMQISAKYPSGLAMSSDKWLLAVADKYSNSVYSYTLSTDGSLQNEQPFFWLHVPDGENTSETEAMCYDKEGHLYVATNFGIQICGANGQPQAILPLPEKEKVTGMCLGGANFDILFVLCKDKVYKRKIKNHGVAAFSEWSPMIKGKL